MWSIHTRPCKGRWKSCDYTTELEQIMITKQKQTIKTLVNSMVRNIVFGNCDRETTACACTYTQYGQIFENQVLSTVNTKIGAS